MRYAHIGGQRFDIRRKTVVLAGDEHLAGIDVFNRVVGTMVAKLHLSGFSTGSQGQQLVAQANAVHRLFHSQEFTNGGDGVIARLRIAGAIR